MGVATKVAESVALVGVRRLAAFMCISATGLMSIQGHEAVVHKVYLDTTGTKTACMGDTSPDLPAVGAYVSDAVCQRLAAKDTAVAVEDVQTLVKVAVTQPQFDALVDFDFNVGRTTFSKSTLLRRINAGECKGLTVEFMKYNKSKGQVLRGLTNRRADEGRAWESGC
jgi:lysozyme